MRSHSYPAAELGRSCRPGLRIGITVALALALGTASTQLHAKSGEDGPVPPPEHEAFPDPTVDELAVKPRTLCVERGDRCPRPGGVIAFEVNDHVAIRLRVYRRAGGDERLARRFFSSASPGKKRVRYRGRGLEPGRYRVEVQATNFFRERGLARSARFRVVN